MTSTLTRTAVVATHFSEVGRTLIALEVFLKGWQPKEVTIEKLMTAFLGSRQNATQRETHLERNELDWLETLRNGSRHDFPSVSELFYRYLTYS